MIFCISSNIRRGVIGIGPLPGDRWCSDGTPNNGSEVFPCSDSSVQLTAYLRLDQHAREMATATAILDKAIQAMGGEEKLGKAETLTWKTTGRLIGNGTETDFKSQVTVKGLEHLRRELGNDQFKMLIVVNFGIIEESHQATAHLPARLFRFFPSRRGKSEIGQPPC